jgi:hypothetical protein
MVSNCLFHGRDLRYEGDEDICSYCNGVAYVPLPDWTYEQFAILTRTHAELMSVLESRVKRILDRMKHRGWLKEADEYGVTVEYNGACHCHPEPKEFKLPAEWLFADDWQAKVDEYMRQLEAKRLAAEADIDRIREAQERKDLERLQAKYKAV